MRETVERRSAVLLVYLHRLPRALPGLLVLGLVAVGLLVPGVAGAAALVLVALVLGWLLYLSWPALKPQARLIRLAVLALVLVGIVARVIG